MPLEPTPTGPMRTGDGWTGVYLAAQDSRDYAFALEQLLAQANRGGPIEKYTLSRLRRLMETLRSQARPTVVRRNP